jgi:HSP20 family protein
MKIRDPTGWMWSEELDMLERADRMQRQFFQLGAQCPNGPVWEPPVDIFETAQQFVVLAALPGVSPSQLSIMLDGGVVTVRGQRAMPHIGHSTRIRSVEIPYGRFERRIELPATGLRVHERSLADGCLTLVLHKTGEPP